MLVKKEQVRVYGQGGEAFICPLFLVWTGNNFDWVSIREFEPVEPDAHTFVYPKKDDKKLDTENTYT